MQVFEWVKCEKAWGLDFGWVNVWLGVSFFLHCCDFGFLEAGWKLEGKNEWEFGWNDGSYE